VADGDAVVPVVNRLAQHFDHVVLTQDWHPPGHSSFATRMQPQCRSKPSRCPMVRKRCGRIIACGGRRARRFIRDW
jgi:nicotinamidase-related amidase